ncbi:hypothetical protein DLAC_10820 [Tieghemostelium lacteum]|uniref:Leucine-rich repeat-containing protein (LRR) n=1 Tax=Tieghemostelium lacteum TaxID=361077 RepID=A0A151Z3V6_TIELA|nr:hypothetical protein DLAC_10820 [Tieghemostelium lacteum]|eukprot:KYQ88646.1 hypothetical protein DLAC_10820 [Tieghemostelium lacteum]
MLNQLLGAFKKLNPSSTSNSNSTRSSTPLTPEQINLLNLFNNQNPKNGHVISSVNPHVHSIRGTLPNYLLKKILDQLIVEIGRDLYLTNYNSEIISIVRLTLVSKSWSTSIIPQLNYQTAFSISDRSDMILLLKLIENGVVGVPIPLRYLHLKFDENYSNTLKEETLEMLLGSNSSCKFDCLNVDFQMSSHLGWNVKKMLSKIISRFQFTNIVIHGSMVDINQMEQSASKDLQELYMKTSLLLISKLCNLQKFIGLQVLELPNCLIGEHIEFLEKQSTFRFQFPLLRKLNLSYNMLADKVGFVAKCLEDNTPNLEILDLERNDFNSSVATECLFPVLQRLVKLHTLNISNNKIYLQKLNRFTLSLTHLNASALCGDTNSQSAIEFVVGNGPSLRYLEFSPAFMFLNLSESLVLFRSLVDHKCRNIKSLELCKLNMSNSILEVFKEFLESLHSLSKLFLNIVLFNNDSECKNQYLSYILKSKTIRDLTLQAHEINSIHCKVIAESLQNNNVLESLDLSNNVLLGSGANSIMSSLTLNNTLKSLSMNYCFINSSSYNSDSISHIVYNRTTPNIKTFHSNSLQTLSLNDNYLNSFDLSVILGSLKSSNSIKLINLKGITQEDTLVKEFQKYKPKTTILF